MKRWQGGKIMQLREADVNDKEAIIQMYNEYIKEIETAFYELLNKLRKNGVKFHFIDESILEKYGTIKQIYTSGRSFRANQRKFYVQKISYKGEKKDGNAVFLNSFCV